MRRIHAIVAGLGMTLGLGAVTGAVAPAGALGQTRPDSIDPGMTHDQVISRLGAPSEERVSGSFDYMYYDNQCGQKCGMDDLVILEQGIVTDAVFRSKTRVYTGVSSSPHEVSPAAPAHMAPAPIRAATADDSAHRGGIVFAPRTTPPPPKYVRIVPTHADSARVASTSSAMLPAPAASPPVVAPADSASGASGAVKPDTAAPH